MPHPSCHSSSCPSHRRLLKAFCSLSACLLHLHSLHHTFQVDRSPPSAQTAPPRSQMTFMWRNSLCITSVVFVAPRVRTPLSKSPTVSHKTHPLGAPFCDSLPAPELPLLPRTLAGPALAPGLHPSHSASGFSPTPINLTQPLSLSLPPPWPHRPTQRSVYSGPGSWLEECYLKRCPGVVGVGLGWPRQTPGSVLAPAQGADQS